MRRGDQTKSKATNGKGKRPVTVDELPSGALPTPAELRRLRQVSAQVASGKMKVRYVEV